MADSATNERQIKKRASQQKRDRITDELITKQLMSTIDGRRWVWLRLSEGNVFYGNENLDPQYMAWEKGVRNSALRLLRDVSSFTPQEYITMTEEARSIKLKEDEDVGSQRNDSDDPGSERGEPVSG
jgi:hypothetical protein